MYIWFDVQLSKWCQLKRTQIERESAEKKNVQLHYHTLSIIQARLHSQLNAQAHAEPNLTFNFYKSVIIYSADSFDFVLQFDLCVVVVAVVVGFFRLNRSSKCDLSIDISQVAYANRWFQAKPFMSCFVFEVCTSAHHPFLLIYTHT